jgi:cysteine desulfurase
MAATKASSSVVIIAAIAIVVVAVVVLSTTHRTRKPDDEDSAATRSGIYLDNNATTPIHPTALSALAHAYRHHFANPSSFHYRCGRSARNLMHRCRVQMCSMLGLHDAEGGSPQLVFTSGATEANNAAVMGCMCRARGRAARPHVLSSPIEHASVAHALAQSDADLQLLPVDRFGRLCLRALHTAIRDDTALVCVIMANNEVGTIQDIRAVVDICRARRVHLHVDVTQVVGKYPLDLWELRVDSASFSAHKFGGPRGVGALYLRDASAVCPWLHGGGQEAGLRSGTENVPGVVAATVALRVALERMSTDAARVQAMAKYLITQVLDTIPGTRLLGHPEHRLYNTVAISLPVDSRRVMMLLDTHWVCVSAGSACTQGAESHTLVAMGLDANTIQGSMRISLWYDNTMAECVRFVELLRRCVAEVGAGAAVEAP